MYPLASRRQMGGMGVGAGGAFTPQYEIPSYENEGGTGDRRSIITVTCDGVFLLTPLTMSPLMVNGNIVELSSYSENAAAVAGKYLKFVFPNYVIINEVTFRASDGIALGVVKWQQSIRDDDTWVDVGESFTLQGGPGNVAVQTAMSGNTTGAKAYRLLGVSGNSNWNAYILEYEFKIGNVTNAETKCIFGMGDSKTYNASATQGYMPKLLSDLDYATEPAIHWVETASRFAAGGWAVADLETYTVANIASVTPTPNYILINVGVNDTTTIEADYKTSLQNILDAIHTEFPSAQVYIMRVWATLAPSHYLLINAWIAEIVALNSFAHLGPNETVFLENGDNGATYTADGIHPTEPAGYQLTADQWRAVLGY